ncbi:nitric oxide reductase activation protein NorD [Candidatus Thiosymbion oneisti]|uniref:nitric oxide reductase activation protein NorD n=1 Tax=Candidatus Thiosymbion oneisti TaxID=589554 RepID=UPI000B163855|nr:VWA domain-containing protein [Candidatus Thiosymbion oneisti]
MPKPLAADQLEDLLEDILWAEASSKRGAALALAGLTRAQQEFALHWVRTLEKDNTACAYQFLIHADRALQALSLPDVERWIIQGLDVYDQSGLYAAVEVFRNVDQFLERARAAQVGASLAEHTGVLERVVLGLSGRRLGLAAAETIHTDTETLFLPAMASRFGSREDNFRFLKAAAAYLWAQTRFGTWRLGIIEALMGFDDTQRALQLFHTFETLRLDARIARELPGVHRDMQHLNTLAGQHTCSPHWEVWRERLRRAGDRARDSLALVAEVMAAPPPLPEPLCYQGELYPERVEEVLRARLEDEKAGLRSLLVRYRKDLESEQPVSERKAFPGEAETPFAARKREHDEHPGEFELEIRFHDQPVSPPEDIKRLIGSIMLDLGELPPDYLVPAGDGYYRPKGAVEADADAGADVWSGTYHERGAHLYNEWDFRRQSYRKNWCVMRELTVEPKRDGFVAATLDKYSRHLPGLRKTFEALRGEDKRLKKEPYGDEVDIDALMEARTDAHRGLEMSDRLFTRRDRVERNIAVMFMVDMSGSTRGWINQAERESLLLLCEALETLGDRYAIYGFSGMTRKRCETFRVKGFDDAYGDEIRGRIAGIEAKDYTRMGAAIRHLTELLDRIDAKTRILITLSDGKPDDYSDEYRSRYGIEDTRRALIEAKRRSIHPFCITIDKEGREYLPHMYGAVNYTIVEAVERLPYKVSEIYRRLTV